MLSDNKNTYLAKWLDNDLSSKELEELKALPEYEDYQKIVKGLSYFNPPSFDLKGSLKITLEKLDQAKKRKVVKLKPLFYTIATAASVALIIGLFFTKITYTSVSGQQLAIVLPDGSAVDLNAGSTLSHQRFFWSKNREVNVVGEAFFKVTSGTNFTVETSSGTIDVLGTQFNVKARKENFEVGCYEGKVRVSSTQNQQKILRKGDAVLLKDKKLIERKITNAAPLWMQGESLFDSVVLEEVLNEIERQYGIIFKRNLIDQKQLFTGGFNYNNLNIALQSVLVPMGIDYVVKGKSVILSSK